RILILEIMGRHANIILTDDEYKIIDSIKHLTPNNNERTVMPGFAYEQPPTDKKLNPRSQEIDDLVKIIDWNRGKVKRQILSHVEGITLVFIDEIEHRSEQITQHKLLTTNKEVMKDAEDIVPVYYD